MAERLIDVNKLEKRRVVTVDGVFTMGATEEDIDNAPVIEAIPISWLQTKADSWNAELKNACPEDAETIRHIQDKYLEIIDEWRK